MIVDLIIPALNEEHSLPLLLKAIDRRIIRDIIVADNGSTDGTAVIATDSGATVIHENRRGYGFACMAGINYCRAKSIPPEVLVFMDGDFADDPDDLKKIIEPIALNGADLVIGSRVSGTRERGSLTIPQLFGNQLAGTLIRIFFGVRFTDLGPFRAIRLSKLVEMNLQEMTYGWTVEMQLRAAGMKMNCVELPVHYRNRYSGTSKVSGTLKGTILAGYRILFVVFRFVFLR
ncbi:MAG: glycosyltransferase family 2 protein [Cyclobacteriaceae bacterium]